MEKILRLKKIIKGYRKLAVSISGGLDSTFLADVSEKVLGAENLLLVHIASVFTPPHETELVKKWAAGKKLKLVILKLDVLKNREIKKNDIQRCYHCKKHILGKVIESASLHGIKTVADGTNCDDYNDYRPGLKASDEKSVRHPLAEAGLTKADIIEHARKSKLPNWDWPASACYASRIPYGTKLDVKILSMISAAEIFLLKNGIIGSRVRYIDDTAKIEVPPKYFIKITGIAEKIVRKFKSIGFKEIYLDLQGYRKGVFNPVKRH